MTAVDVRVVGGGFAGFWAALAARRVLGPAGTVALMSDGPALQLRPRLYECDPHTLAVPLAPLLQRCGIAFEHARATAIRADGEGVHVADDAGLHRVSRRAVLASGSVMARPAVPGIEHAASIDTQAEAIAFDHRLRELAQRPHAPVLAVIGAGFTGIELALELRDRLQQHAGRAVADVARVLLVDAADVPGAALGPGPRPAIEAALRDARVECRLGARVAALSATQLQLQGQPPVDVDLAVLATGLRAAPLAAQLAGEHDALGRIGVNDELRVSAMPALFAAGDAAAADTGDGHVTLMSCQHALRSGRFAGENAARDLQGRPRLRYDHRRYVTCLDLGRAGAVYTEGWDRRVRQTGAAAKAIKQRFNREVIVPPVDADGDTLLALSRIADRPDEA